MPALPDYQISFPDVLYVYGFSARKIKFLESFASCKIVEVEQTAGLAPGDTLVLWGSAPVPADTHAGLRLLRVEDGFIRSVGLGADLVRPLSWVFDDLGIYYDATRPSGLESILQNVRFTEDLIQRARFLQGRIVTSGITKYNVGRGEWEAPQGKHIILVPGQVESDVSIRYGAPDICTNIGLLEKVRQMHPDAYIIYKPHPDVVAGLRSKGQGEMSAVELADEILTDVPMDKLLLQVHEVHLLTSLTGFEALLRGVPVTCHGQPFYSGWGLTTDMIPVSRRTRRLSLSELVAGTLLLYPSYISRHTGDRITAEQALEELMKWRAEGRVMPAWCREIVRKVLRLVVGVR